MDAGRVAAAKDGLDRLVAAGRLPGYVAAVRGGQGRREVAGGVADLGTGAPATTSSVFRVASLSKPVAALLTVRLVESGALRLDDPVAGAVPELAEPRVLAAPAGPVEDTVPLARPVTVRHLLTMTAGWGVPLVPCPLAEEMARLGVLPSPIPPRHDEAHLLDALARLPLAFQPGSGWLYHTSTDVLTVLLERVTGRPVVEQVGELAGELGLDALGFVAEPSRLASAYRARRGPARPGEVEVRPGWVDLDPDGFRELPPRPLLGGGLAGTAADVLAVFDEIASPRVVAPASARAIRSPQVADEVRAGSGMLEPGTSYGFQVQVNTSARPARGGAGAFLWAGGTGCLAMSDPGEDWTAVLLTNRAMGDAGGSESFDVFLDALLG